MVNPAKLSIVYIPGLAPKMGVFPDPPKMGGFWGVPAKHVFRAKCAKCVFLHTPANTGVNIQMSDTVGVDGFRG